MKKRIMEYDFKDGDNIKEYSVRQKIVYYLLKNPNTYYKHQEMLRIAMKDAGIDISQGAVSKGLGKLLHKRQHSNQGDFLIEKSSEGYRLAYGENLRSTVMTDFVRRGCFSKKYVFHELVDKPMMFVFWITPENAVSPYDAQTIRGKIRKTSENPETDADKEIRQKGRKILVEEFKRYIGEDRYADVFVYRDKVIILLNPETVNSTKSFNVRENLKNFFKIHDPMEKETKR